MRRPSPWLHTLIAAGTLMVIAAAFVLSASSQRELKKMAVAEFNRQQLILARSAVNSIEIYFNAMIGELSALTDRPEIHRMSPESLELLKHAYWGFPQRTSIRLLDHQGVMSFIYPCTGWRKKLIGKPYGGNEYFRKAMETGRITLSPLIYNERGEARIRIAVPIFPPERTDTADERDPNGPATRPTDPPVVLVGSLDPEIIADNLISPIRSGETGYAWVLDSEGVFLHHYLNEFVGRNAFQIRRTRNPFFSYEAIDEIQHRMMAGAEGKGRYISGWHRDQAGQVEKLVAYAPVQILDKTWSVAVCAPLSEVEEIANRAQRSERHSLILVTLVLTLCGAFFFVTSYRWSRSLELEVEKQTKDLEANEKRMRAIVNASPVGIGLFINRKASWLNKAMHDMIGYEKGAFLGKDVKALYPDPEEYERVGRELYADINKSGTNSMETRMVRKNGTFLDCYLQACAVDPSDPSQGYIVVVMDISEQKNNAQQKKTLENRLRQAEKMESLGSLAGGIAHDFNNILFPIVGYTEVLLQEAPEGGDAQNLLERILKATDRATDLVKQILTFSRRGETGLKPIRMQPVVKEALKLIRASIPTTIEIHQHMENDGGIIMGDPTRIHQIVMNLCTNAYHAMEDKGGKIDVTLTEIEFKDDAHGLMGMKPGAYSALTVSDTGMGMPPEILKRIFEPYFTTKEMGKGTGMGLSVVYGIVKEFGGDIRVDSEPGKGSAFHVYIPAIHARDKGTEPSRRDDFSGGNERILLVDDDKDAVFVQKEMLQQLGYTVTHRTDSLAALALLQACPNDFGLVITDLTMPHMTGDKLTQELANIRPCIPIILCTGSNENMSEEKARRLGIKGFFRKPIKMGTLAKIVRQALAPIPILTGNHQPPS